MAARVPKIPIFPGHGNGADSGVGAVNCLEDATMVSFVGLFSRKPKEPDKSVPAGKGMLWADSADAKKVLKAGRERKPSYRWRCCRCGAGFVLPIEPEKVPVPWWYYEAIMAGGWKEKHYPWSCPECGTFSYTVPL